MDINAEEKVEDKLAPGELEELNIEEGNEQRAEKKELSPEEQLKSLETGVEAKQEEINRLLESVEGTKSALNATREKLGLPPTEEDPPSVFSDKEDRLEKLKTEKEALEKQKEEIISHQEKEQLIREEKEKILQEKIDEVFKEFETLNSRDFESILKSGKTSEGRNVESRSTGSLNPEVAQSLAKTFKEGIKLLPKILEALPELLKNFDEDLITKEATERVEKKLEEGEQKKEDKSEEMKLEEKPGASEDEVPLDEEKPETDPADSDDAEPSKA
ncbi:MAG: hypothetical protein ACQESA_00585 [Patescibacteria group bacterium]